MKITVITSSAHKHGTSAMMADEFIRGAQEAGHDVFRFDAAFKNIHPCIGCAKCQSGEGKCVFKDDMQELNPELVAADLLVLISPIYYFDVNGQMKATIDRFFANNMKLYGQTKKFALITTMADPAYAAEGANTSFKLIADLYKWDVAGIINAENSGDVDALKKTDFLKQAYEFGKSV
ncbi:MAG: flavodoxin family protein [Lachnospiraceae bacterium]|nr:flavodoxin family protein [Lachnospiraceae bacterium]